MLSTARQSCGRGLASWAQALPAESSRQALLRVSTSAPPTGCSPAGSSVRGIRTVHGKATYSAAAAVQLASEERHFPSHPYLPTFDHHYTHDRTDHIPDPRPPDPAPAPAHPMPQLNLTRLELFRALHTSRPFDALRLLCDLEYSETSRIPIGEIQGLLNALRRVSAARPRMLEKVDEEVVENGLSIIRDLLHDYPLPMPDSKGIHPPGHRFRGRHVSTFLSTCLATRQLRLLRSTFRERAKVQEETGDRLLSLDDLIFRLSKLRSWTLILSLFAPTKFSFRFYTPIILERYMLAHLATKQPEAIPRLFAQHEVLGLQPTAESFAHLTQAYLRLGDFLAAKEAAERAELEGRYDAAAQQLALLRGHRALGSDKDLLSNVLADLESMGRRPDAGLLNAIVKLRCQAQDYTGATDLLRLFHLDESQPADDRIKPNAETRILAFTISANHADLGMIQAAWRGLVYRGEEITDRYFSLLIQALARLSHSILAFDIIQRAFERQYSPDWPVPETFRPSASSLNTLLKTISTKEGLAGLSNVTQLFKRYSIPIDSETITLILKFAKHDERFSPPQLVGLARQLSQDGNDLKPTVSQLDLLLSHAVHIAGRTRASSLRKLPSEPITSPTSDASTKSFQRVIKPILTSLRARGIRSTPLSLRNRLRFDTYASVRRSTLPAARDVWNNLISRGFKPNRSHLIALMRAYADVGAMSECKTLLSLSREMGWAVDKDMQMILLVGWGRKGEYEKAKDAYRTWKGLSGGTTDIIAASAMVQAASRSGLYSTAVSLVGTEMRGLELDHPAAEIAANAYRQKGRYVDALNVVESVGPALSPPLRRLVRVIKRYCAIRGPFDIPTRCDAILAADDQARPIHTRRYRSKRSATRILALVRRRKTRRLRVIKKRWSQKTRARRRTEREAEAQVQAQAAPSEAEAQQHLSEQWTMAQSIPVPVMPRI